MKRGVIFLFALMVSLSAGSLPEVSVAATDAVCGDISGTVTHGNGNVKNVYFDGEKNEVDISVVAGAGAKGFAPKAANAACSENNFDGTYDLKGYVFGDNLGFISLYCDGKSGKPGNNRGVACGEQSYGVKVSAVSGGARTLSGYAWNEVLGYMNFATDGQKVVLKQASPGATTWVAQANSWVYTQAKLWMKLDGVKFELPEENPKEVWDNPYCADKEWACVEVRPVVDGGEVDPDGGAGTEWGYGIDDFTAIADGKQGYEVHLFLKDGAKNALKLEDFNLNLEFNWKDTVKLNQMSGKSGDFAGKAEALGDGGGVVYKPINLKNADFVAGKEAGHYVLNKTIRSLAPTSNANLSEMAGLKSTYLVKNGVFFSKLSENGQVWTDKIESNDLILKHVKASLKDKASGVEQIPDANKVIYSNGEALALKFRPPVELHTLYANNKQDYFTAYRNIPMTFTLQGREVGGAKFTGEPKIDLKLTYSEQQTVQLCFGETVTNFDFKFYEDKEVTQAVKNYKLNELKELKTLHGIAKLMTLEEWKALDGNEEKDENEYKPCDLAQGPTLYSEVSYGIFNPVAESRGGAGRGETSYQVKYYHNLLPRIDASKISNPTIFVSGNVYTSSAFSTSSETEAIQTSGNINVNVVRNTIYENVKKYTGGKSVDARECVITDLSLQPRSFTEGCGVVINPIGGEQIFYAKGDISLKLSDKKFRDRKIIVSDGGNIFIDSDVYNGTPDVEKYHLTLVALKKDKYGPTGNVYLHPDVKNFQGTIIADGSFRSYFGDKDVSFDDEGRPEGDFNQMLYNLNNQFKCDCNIFSRNTIGGADLPAAETPKPYLLLGTGKTIELPASEDDRLKAIKDDLNYLRLFTLDLEVETDTGLPKDQKCGKYLSVDDMAKIAQGDKVYFDGKQCDGINPLKTAPNGDLMPQISAGAKADGMELETQYLPVYVYYTPIPKDSVLFGK